MTVRSIVLGLLLAMGLCAFTYYNDWVIEQNSLIGGLLPFSVFGTMVLLVLLVNPLLWLLRPRWTFGPGELAVIVGLGLAAASFPGSAFSRVYSPMMVLPAHWLPTTTSWQGAEVLSYLPGGSSRLASGHVRDWPGFCRRLAHEAADASSAAHDLWTTLDDEAQAMIRQVAQEGHAADSQQRRMLAAINAVLPQDGLFGAAAIEAAPLPASADALLKRYGAGTLSADQIEKLNRLVLATVFSEHVSPAPPGRGVMLLGGRHDPAVTDLAISGAPSDQRVRLAEIPWAAWWPTMRLWGGLFLLLATASLCLVLIVHPQWSRRELLPYPVVRFAELAIARQPGRRLPDVAYARLFWYGLGAMLLLHCINGLHAWWPEFPLYIRMRHDFSALMDLFPNALKVPGSWGLYRPFIFPSVIAFSFFLTTEVSLSLGLSMFIWTAFASVLVANGISIRDSSSEGGNEALILFGAFAGMALMMLYAGRRHYVNVAAAAVGLRRPDTPRYCAWAARVLILCVALAPLLLRTGGLDPVLGLVLFVLMLLLVLVLARINAETGAFMIHAGWVPVAVMVSLLGNVAIGPTPYIVLALASLICMIDPADAVMPQLANAMRLLDRPDALRPARAAPWMIGIIVIGLAVTTTIVLSLHYNIGMTETVGWWVREQVSHMPFDRQTTMIWDLTASGQLETSVQTSSLDRLWHIAPRQGALGWVALGLALVLICTLARLRLPWWPIHPVLFVFWGTFPSIMLSVSFLIGWAIKKAVVQLGGARAVSQFMPLMVGVIAGELLSGLVWISIGAGYYLFTHGLHPPVYSVYPR